MLISSKKTLAALTALAKEEERWDQRPSWSVKDWWFQSVRAGSPLLGLFYLNKTPGEMGKTYRQIIWE